MKKCAICRKPIKNLYRSTQKVCAYQDNKECSEEWAKRERERKSRKEATRKRVELREAKEKAKTRADWLADVQKVFNAYIRARDGKVCISCGTTKHDIQYCAGHYRTRGAAGHLRFNEDNTHAQCNQNCNLKLSGNIINYRPRLIDKIGIERVESLENDNTTHKWTIEELKAIKQKYKLKLKQLTGG